MYTLLSYAADGQPRAAIEVDGTAYDLARAGGGRELPATTNIELVRSWDTSEPALDALAEDAAAGRLEDAAIGPVGDLTLRAPLLYPNILFMAGSNYGKHTAEMQGAAFDKTKRRPYFFLKLARQCVIGSGESIRLPHTSKQVDWEVELAYVIGRPARNVKAADALDYVAGYTICHDVSLRDIGHREDWPNWSRDWIMHKSCDTGAPMGPRMVPAKFIDDPHDLDLKTWVNEEAMQDSNTSDLTFDINEQIEFLSEYFTLLPGDVVSTGTPSGVGRPRGIFLKPGDTVRMEIKHIGTITNPVVAGE